MTTPTDNSSKLGRVVHIGDEEQISKRVIDEFSTSIPKKHLKRLKQEL